MPIKLTKAQQAKKKSNLCITPFCRRRPGRKGHNKCFECERKVYIAGHPLEYAYGIKKRNARQKKKYFILTFEEFKEFAIKNDYMNKKGISAKSLQMDRKEECSIDCPDFCEKHGYFKANIQAITLRENRYKYSKHMGHNVADEFVPF